MSCQSYKHGVQVVRLEIVLRCWLTAINHLFAHRTISVSCGAMVVSYVANAKFPDTCPSVDKHVQYLNHIIASVSFFFFFISFRIMFCNILLVYVKTLAGS